jgi:hypothetical protein
MSPAAKQRRPQPFQVTTNFEIPRDFSKCLIPEVKEVYFLEGLDNIATLMS